MRTFKALFAVPGDYITLYDEAGEPVRVVQACDFRVAKIEAKGVTDATRIARTLMRQGADTLTSVTLDARSTDENLEDGIGLIEVYPLYYDVPVRAITVADLDDLQGYARHVAGGRKLFVMPTVSGVVQ